MDPSFCHIVCGRRKTKHCEENMWTIWKLSTETHHQIQDGELKGQPGGESVGMLAARINILHAVMPLLLQQ